MRDFNVSNFRVIEESNLMKGDARVYEHSNIMQIAGLYSHKVRIGLKQPSNNSGKGKFIINGNTL